jgi:EmrB/QacA subfamily drug resistance transporter
MTDSQKWWALGFLVLAQFMIVLDVSIVNVALPSIERTLGLTVADLQLIVTAYTLCFGGFLLLGGRTADLYGRRTVFVTGVIAFSVISLLIGLSTSATMLVALRALQGLSAAFMSPSALSLVLTLFTEQTQRTRALSIWGAVSAGGATAGLLLGGILTQYLSWHWNFFVNVPIGIVVAIAALKLLPAHVAEEEQRNLDLPGALLVTSGLMLLVYTLSHANAWGWGSSSTWGFLAGSVALLIAFVVNEYYARHPLVPLSIFRIGNIAGANITLMPITASMFAMFFFLSLYVQNILQYSPLRTGLSFLPTSLIIGASALSAPMLIRRIGYKAILVIAPLFLSVGLFIFGHLRVDSSYWSILPGLLIMPLGLGFSFVAVTVAATSGVPGRESGLASGLLTTAQQIGGSLGLAILSSVAASRTVQAIASGSSVPLAAVTGYHAAFYTGVGFALLASLLALTFIRQQKTLSMESVHTSSV